MVLVQFNTKNAVQELVDAVESGQLSKDELDAKCRKVLMYKYMLGLRNRQPQLRVSGMSYRINTEEAQALAAVAPFGSDCIEQLFRCPPAGTGGR